MSDDLWTEATRDIEAESRLRRLIAARSHMGTSWSFVMAAQDPVEYVNRKHLVADRLADAVIAAVGEDDPILLEDLTASLDADFAQVNGERIAAKVIAQVEKAGSEGPWYCKHCNGQIAGGPETGWRHIGPAEQGHGSAADADHSAEPGGSTSPKTAAHGLPESMPTVQWTDNDNDSARAIGDGYDLDAYSFGGGTYGWTLRLTDAAGGGPRVVFSGEANSLAAAKAEAERHLLGFYDEGVFLSSRKSAAFPPIDNPRSTWTLTEGTENWIGLFTDEALAENERFWLSDEGRGLQEHMPGGAQAYADAMLKMIRDEKARRSSTTAASRKTADDSISSGYTRLSIPTQLRQAGHTVEATSSPDGRILYIVDGEEMDLKTAADRFLGGWDNAFGRGPTTGSRRIAVGPGDTVEYDGETWVISNETEDKWALSKPENYPAYGQGKWVPKSEVGEATGRGPGFDTERFPGTEPKNSSRGRRPFGKTASKRYEIAKDVLDNGIFDANGKTKKLEGAILDAMTAQALVQVYEALSPASQEKFDSIPLQKLIDFVWSKVRIGSHTAAERCYSDHNEDIRTKGSCDLCGGTEPDPPEGEKTSALDTIKQFLASGFRKGAPFAGYTDFDECVSKNSDKRDPEAYCGSIKHKVETTASKTAAAQEVSGDSLEDVARKVQAEMADGASPKLVVANVNGERRVIEVMPKAFGPRYTDMGTYESFYGTTASKTAGDDHESWSQNATPTSKCRKCGKTGSGEDAFSICPSCGVGADDIETTFEKKASADWGEGVVGKQLLGAPGSKIIDVQPTTDYLTHGPVGDGWMEGDRPVTTDFIVTVRYEDGHEGKLPKSYQWLQKQKANTDTVTASKVASFVVGDQVTLTADDDDPDLNITVPAGTTVTVEDVDEQGWLYVTYNGQDVVIDPAKVQKSARRLTATDVSRWVYVDGGKEYGWFSDEEKAEMDSTRAPNATYTWRKLTPEEVEAFYGWAGDLKHQQGSRRKTAAPSDGQRSYCRICGIEMEGQDYTWYALSASSPQRETPEHVHLPARSTGRAGEYGPDGALVPGTPGGEGGQYDAPAGTIYDGAARPIQIGASRKLAEDAATTHSPDTPEGGPHVGPKEECPICTTSGGEGDPQHSVGDFFTQGSVTVNAAPKPGDQWTNGIVEYVEQVAPNHLTAYFHTPRGREARHVVVAQGTQPGFDPTAPTQGNPFAAQPIAPPPTSVPDAANQTPSADPLDPRRQRPNGAPADMAAPSPAGVQQGFATRR